MSVTSELIAFLYFAIAGMISGCVFDLFRCKRRNFNTPNIVVCIEDMLFWFIIGVIALYTSYIASNGQVRIYMLISMVLGALIYFLTFSKLFYKVFEFLCRYIKRLLEMVLKVFKGGKNETKVQKV